MNESRSGSSEPADPGSTPLRVLLVEDSEDDALLILRELRRGGFDPHARRVERRENFLNALEDEGWDVVISDYAMPEFDGLSALALIRERKLRLPFIFVSGHIGEERAVEAMRHGVSDYLNKDRLGRLVPAVERVLRESEAQRRELEMAEALRASEERLRQLAHHAPDIIYEYTFEPQPGFAFVSPAAEALTGYSPGEHYEEPNLWLRIVHREDRDTLASLLQPREDVTERTQTLRWQHRDGSVRWVEQRTTPLYDDNGRLRAIEGIVRDVTDRKELEAQFLAAQRMEGIGRLAGGIAHDFNNMLTVIQGYCSLLRQKLADSEVHLRSLEKIETATERATSLVRQLLAFSRRQPRNLELLELDRVLTQFAPMVRRLIGEDLQVDIVTGAPGAIVRADRSQLEQILMNLVVNARDAMPNGGRLTLATEVPVPSGDLVRLTVTDTGIGMDESVLQRIFDPFYTTKDVGKGTGLGLSTVYGIVTQMEGKIHVTSTPGVGTRFMVDLPLAEGLPEQAPLPPLDAEAAGTGTILLVEDEELVRETTERILAAQGYTILAAGDGQQALQAVAGYERQIDLLLTDMLMPGISGMELARRMRERLPDIPVLYMSGYNETDLPSQGVPGQADELLQKPFNSRTLLAKVREALTRRHGDS